MQICSVVPRMLLLVDVTYADACCERRTACSSCSVAPGMLLLMDRPMRMHAVYAGLCACTNEHHLCRLRPVPRQQVLLCLQVPLHLHSKL